MQLCTVGKYNGNSVAVNQSSIHFQIHNLYPSTTASRPEIVSLCRTIPHLRRKAVESRDPLQKQPHRLINRRSLLSTEMVQPTLRGCSRRQFRTPFEIVPSRKWSCGMDGMRVGRACQSCKRSYTLSIECKRPLKVSSRRAWFWHTAFGGAQ